LFLPAIVCLTGCGPNVSKLEKFARDREAPVIIKALTACQKAKGDFPPAAAVASDLIPYTPAGVKLNFWSGVYADEYTAWQYRRDGSPGQYELLIRVEQGAYLQYIFEKGVGTWYFTYDTGDLSGRNKIFILP